MCEYEVRTRTWWMSCGLLVLSGLVVLLLILDYTTGKFFLLNGGVV